MKKNIIFLGILGILVLGVSSYWLTSNQQKKFQETYSQDIKKYPFVRSQEIVSLQDGDSYNLTASIVKKEINGKQVKMLAYNGSIPGPLIKVPQGGEITLNFKNDTDVDSTIHSHGVRAENKFDGVPDVTQKAVKPGEMFTYKLTFPDVGIYWYHPHIREDYAQELGLYGNFLVTPEKNEYWSDVDREVTLFLDDILLVNGQIAQFNKQVVDHTLMGRFGNTMLVNGETAYILPVKQGEKIRFYITNAANTRVFNFTIPNVRMKLVGGDNGKYERENWSDGIILGPSERAVVEVGFDTPGNYTIANNTPEKTYKMGTIAVSESPMTASFTGLRTNQDLIDSLNAIRPLFAKPVDKSLQLTLAMGQEMMSQNQEGNDMHSMHGGEMMSNDAMMMDDTVEKIEWEDTMGMMNANSTTKTLTWKLVDAQTKQENMDIKWKFKKGEKVKLSVFNDPTSQHPMQHPIHIHGQRFLVTSINDTPNTNLVWKDTVLVQSGDTVELLVDMDNPGEWMIHCHIPEHMEAGMMAGFTVI